MIKTARFEDILAGESAEMRRRVAILAEELRKQITLRRLREEPGETQAGLVTGSARKKADNR